MSQKNKTPQAAGTVNGEKDKTSKPCLETNYISALIGSLPIQHKQIMDYLAIAGNSLTTPDAAEMGIQHLPTKLSEIDRTIGIYAQRSCLSSGFFQYSLSVDDRKWWLEVRGGA